LLILCSFLLTIHPYIYLSTLSLHDALPILFTNLGSIVHSSGVIEGLLQNIEVFSIWGYILTGLGLHIVANFSKKTAWIIVSAFFVINIIFSIVGSYFSQMVGV